MNGPSLKTVIPYMVIGALIALGLGAAVVRALDWEGDWEVGVLVAAAVGAAGWKVWTDIVKPWRLERNAETAESRHSQAVGLSLRRRGNPNACHRLRGANHTPHPNQRPASWHVWRAPRKPDFGNSRVFDIIGS